MTPHDGQAIYSHRVLSIYDLWVLGISNRWIWKCPTSRLLEFHNSHVTDRHLDIGVGTGYYLDKCHYPSESPAITLMDLNNNSLQYAAKRIRRYSPSVIQHDVLTPFPEDTPQFDSISMNFLLHCLPGTMQEKAVAFKHAKAALNPGGTLFGSTIVADEDRSGHLARKLMATYNGKGIFGNTSDTTAALTDALSAEFAEPRIQLLGCVAMFSATRTT